MSPSKSSSAAGKSDSSPAGGAFVCLPSSALQKRYLKPGDLIVCREPCVVTTVLGSCVAVTFFSARLKLAAICHAMLPEPRGREERSDFWDQKWKYVSYVVAEMIRCFQAAVPACDVQVKLFGGARLLSSTAETRTFPSVGSANVALARQLLTGAGYAICASDVGGVIGRRVVFNTESGAVHVKRLSRAKVDALTLFPTEAHPLEMVR